jgi:beta-glucanase (GH16 family)
MAPAARFCAAQTQGCSVSGSDTTGDPQSMAYCTPQVIDGRTKLYSNSFASGANPSRGGWIALYRSGDMSNSEQECYNPQNVFIQNGILTIELRAITQTCHYYPAQVGSSSETQPLTSAFVQWNTYYYTDGDLQVRMIGPTTANGAWPALWLLGYNCELTSKVSADNFTFAGQTCDWPYAGSEEIDMFEQPAGMGTSYSMCNFYANGSQQYSTEYSIPNASTNWNVYELQWTSSSLTWLLNGTSVCSYTGSYIPSTPMFLQMNVAVTSSGTTAAAPNRMQIDWVKVCQPSPCNSSGSNIVFFDDFVEPNATTVLRPLLRLAAMAGRGTPPGAAYGLRAVPHFVEPRWFFPEERHVFKEMPCEDFSWFCSEF